MYLFCKFFLYLLCVLQCTITEVRFFFVHKVTGVSPNASTNPSPISSSVLNGESSSQTDTESEVSVPVIKVNGMYLHHNKNVQTTKR